MQEKWAFLLPSLEEERWPSEVEISKMITQVLSPQAEEIQTFKHSRIYEKTELQARCSGLTWTHKLRSFH